MTNTVVGARGSRWVPNMLCASFASEIVIKAPLFYPYVYNVITFGPVLYGYAQKTVTFLRASVRAPTLDQLTYRTSPGGS